MTSHDARKPPDGTPRKMPYCIQVMRLLTKPEVAIDVGPEVCWLLIVILNTQDIRHYDGPVTFWNEHLTNACGFASEGRLRRARQNAVKAGWLEYEPGRKGRAGTYCVVIPPHLRKTLNGDVDDSPPICTSIMDVQNGGENRKKPICTSIMDEQNGGEKRKKPICTSIMDEQTVGIQTHNPLNTNTCARSNAKHRVNRYGDHFETWYACYPRKAAKADAKKAYAHAVKELGGKQDNPENYLLDRVKAYAAAVASCQADYKFLPYPATWLRKGQYDDDPTALSGSGRGTGPAPRTITRLIPPVRD